MPACLALALALGLAPAARAAVLPGELLITELMVDPVVDDADGEWFEVRNATEGELDLDGLAVQSDGDAGFTVVGSFVVGAGESVVFAANAIVAENGGFGVDRAYDPATLALDATDALSIHWGGVQLDAVAWDAATWPGGERVALQVDAAGAATLDHPIIALEWANDLPGNWCGATVEQTVPGSSETWTGTPGSTNTVCPDAGTDDDGDGFTETTGDCDDTDPDVNPDAIDGDGEPFGQPDDDADCDGVRDDGTTDDDGDGLSEVGGDCDDDAADVFPGATETLDGRDEDCNGCADDLDEDGDGWTGCDTGAVVDCAPDDGVDCDADALASGTYVEGTCAWAFDCDDGAADHAPCAPESFYDGVDQSCDGFDACDQDGDGWDAEGCEGGPGEARDCDDLDPAISPDGDEGDPRTGGEPNDKDDDCDGQVDEPYLDEDGDGVTVAQGDCMDTGDGADAVYPGAEELCDGLDNDCDGFYDEACADARGRARIGGGGLCGVAPGAGGLAAGLLALVALARRRRA
jgi:hypothetical protein